MPDYSQKGFAQLAILIFVILGLAVGVYLVQHPTLFKPKASNFDHQLVFDKKILLWTPIFDTNLNEKFVRKIADSRINGFLIDGNIPAGADDFMNGGVKRRSAQSYLAFFSQVKESNRLAASLGVDSIFIRLLAGDAGYWDVFNESDTSQIIQTAKNQAKFAKETGLRGIWLDAEAYNHPLWQQDIDESRGAYGKSEAEVRSKYFDLGIKFMTALVQEYPDIELLFAPSFHNDGIYTRYKYLPEFFAGMMSVESRNGVVRTNESSYGYSDRGNLTHIQRFENGEFNIEGTKDESGQWTSVRDVLKNRDKLTGDDYLWNIFKTRSPLALAFWIPREESATNIANFKNAVLIDRELSGKYSWIYDEYGVWVKDDHSCPFSWDSNLPCYAKVLQEILPPLISPPDPDNPKKYISYQVSCSDGEGITPEQICQKVNNTSVEITKGIAAKGYWWHQCAGASMSDCEGFNCKVNTLDCTNLSDTAGKQQPYPGKYIKAGGKDTLYQAEMDGITCKGSNPGWTVRLSCNETAPVPTPSTSPDPKEQITYIDFQVTCHTHDLTPDQICIQKGFSRSIEVSGTTAAKGYYWTQCAGASVKNCQGLNCEVSDLDCTNLSDTAGKQQPYPGKYIQEKGRNASFEVESFDFICQGSNLGWTARVACI